MFCKYSSGFIGKGSQNIENVFFRDYMPEAPDKCVKVYLFGLYLNATNPDMSIEDFSKILNISVEEAKDCFYYWKEQGIIQIESDEPFNVKYLQILEQMYNLKKYNKDEFVDFNLACNQLLNGRGVSPNELVEYYTLIKSFHMKQDALLLVIKYCVEQKGNRVNYPYILAVAKDWAYAGILTEEQVQNKLQEMQTNSPELNDLFKLLGIKRKPNYNDYNELIIWKEDLGFSIEAIYHLAKLQKRHGGMEKLHSKIVKYYENKLFSTKEIDDYEKNLTTMKNLSKDVCKKLGLYYETFDSVVDTYINPWMAKGYDTDMILLIADNCFKTSVRTLEGMNMHVAKLYKLGVISRESFNQYMGQISSKDEIVKEILDKCGLVRKVNNNDRTFYKNWTENWGFDNDIILYASSLATGTIQPMSYLNKILSNYKDNKITSLEMAKDHKTTGNKNNMQKTHSDFKQRSYSEEQLKSLIDNLDEVKF